MDGAGTGIMADVQKTSYVSLAPSERSREQRMEGDGRGRVNGMFVCLEGHKSILMSF